MTRDVQLGPVQIEVSANWPRGGEKDIVECPREQWDAMTPAERVKWCEDAARDHAENYVRWSYDVFGMDAEGLL